MTTPPVDLDRIEALLSKATPGPWAWQMEDATCLALYGPGGAEHHVLWSRICPSCAERGWACTAARKDDQDCIAELHNAAPAMVAELRALRAQLLGVELSLRTLCAVVDPAPSFEVSVAQMKGLGLWREPMDRIAEEADDFASNPVKREAFLRNLRDPNR
jgi:hypothetical protein